MLEEGTLENCVGLVWFGHSCFKINAGCGTIYLDPIRKNCMIGTTLDPRNEGDVSAVLVSHEHWDHFDAETILALASESTKVYCPMEVAGPLSCSLSFKARDLEEYERLADSIVPLKKGDTACVGGCRIVCLGASEGICFLVECASRKILFMGDSVATDEMISARPDVILFPVWAVKGKEANPEAFSKLAEESTCVPMHYHTSRNGFPNFFVEPEDLRTLLPKSLRMRILDRGKMCSV